MVYFDLFNFPNIIQFGFWGNIQKVQTLIERPVNSKKPIQSIQNNWQAKVKRNIVLVSF